MQRPVSRPSLLAISLFGFCCVAFATPAFLVSRGHTVAGDRQKESAADISTISANAVQNKDGAARQQQQQQQQQRR